MDFSSEDWNQQTVIELTSQKNEKKRKRKKEKDKKKRKKKRKQFFFS